MAMNTTFFQNNRQVFMNCLDGGIAVLAAYTSMQQSHDRAAQFTQEANFWYVTGIDQPNWRLILDASKGKSWLVYPDVSEVHAVFDGSLSPDDARKISGVDEVISQSEASDMLARFSQTHSVVHTIGDEPHAEYYDFVQNPAQKSLWRQLAGQFGDVRDCRLQLAKIRAIKQPAEIQAIKKAVKLTNEAFSLVKERLPTLTYEYEVEAEFTYHFRRHGSYHAYEPIVASGKNACTLHYDKNNDRLQKGGLLLLDIGASVDGYPADITRTYAVGVPTKRAAAVHHAVARAHNNIISMLRPGLSVMEYQERVDEIMKHELMTLDLIKSVDDEVAYRRYFPHAISHGLGVDVHDSLGRPTEFTSGMVLTVEPGIYIPEEEIGVRLEDDILITDSGHQNLSKALSLDL